MKSTVLLFLSRFLTKSGDNAWFFAVPLALVHIFPGTLRPVSLFFLLRSILVSVIMPACGRWLDKKKRGTAVSATVLPQAVLMIGVALSIGLLVMGEQPSSGLNEFREFMLFGVLVGLASLSQAASHLSSVLVTADFIPNLFRDKSLTRANTIVRRIDLLTEILSPVLAGYILAGLPWDPFLTSGLALIAVWNIVSFLMEFAVLRFFLDQGALSDQRHSDVASAIETSANSFERMRVGMRIFAKQTAFLPMLGLAIMHITVLSGPSVLGTSFLKAGWELSEDVIGLFRGAGAVMSILATMFASSILDRRGLAGATAFFSSLQAIFVVLAAVVFFFGPNAAAIYLILIVFSRFGHSGFILCEMQIRQETVPQSDLGLINGIALSLNSAGAFVILLLGVIFSDPSQYIYLVLTSAVAISSCALLTRHWAKYGKGTVELKAASPLNG